MRILIHILLLIMILLLINILGYSMSEDYRFFLKKLKYQEEVVYDSSLKVNDTNTLDIIDASPEKVLETQKIQPSGTGFTFLDALSGKKLVSADPILPELSWEHKAFLALFWDFSLEEQAVQDSLFWLTTEYPDPYYEFAGEQLTLYIFPTKTYSEVKKIFSVLEYETPFTINETSAFGEASFFINIDPTFSDDSVRLVFEFQKKLFWLKIKKDIYNSVKEILNSLKTTP